MDQLNTVHLIISPWRQTRALHKLVGGVLTTSCILRECCNHNIHPTPSLSQQQTYTSYHGNTLHWTAIPYVLCTWDDPRNV